MNARMGLKEFFAMEASEYIDRLDVLVSAADGPDREELLRLARALRGSALMANEQQIGEVAAALENFARAVREGRTPWDEATKHIAIRAVDDVRILVRKVGEWSGTEDTIATAAAEELNAAAGEVKPVRPSRAEAREAGIDSGTRAFVARECATVASALNAAAKNLQQETPRPNQFDDLLKTMQPLLGLAVLPEISPIPEVMDGVERAAGIARRGEQTGDIALLFDVAERALSHAAQEITSEGTARPDSPEAREFARRFGAILDASGEVVPIQSLYYDDGGPHILEAGTPVAAPGRLAQMELVAHGEHLKQAADELERAQWDTQRELRALALTSTFRSLVSAGGGPVENAVSQFAHVAQEAVRHGVPLHHTEEFAGYLREVGAILTVSAEGEPGGLAARLTQATARLEALPTAAQPPQVEAEADHPTRPPAPSAAVTVYVDEGPESAIVTASVADLPAIEREPEVVDVTVADQPPVEAVTAVAEDHWTADQAAVVAAVPDAEPAPEPAEEPVATQAIENDTADPGLVASWARYEQLEQETEPSEPSIDELLGIAQPAEQPVTVTEAEAPVVAEESTEDVIPITQLGYDEPAAVAAVEDESSEPPAAVAIPITELCYSGSAALEQAYSVRDQIRTALAETDLQGPHLQDLVDELLDLVDLSIEK